MSGATTTQIAGGRTAASIRREERRGFLILGMSPATHVVLIGLACLIWWIARGMVNQTVTIENAAEVHFVLDPSLRSKWAIVPPKPQPTVSVDLSGPSAEVTGYAGTLQANRGAFRYVYVVRPSDVERLEVDANQQAVIGRELSEFKEEGYEQRSEVRILPPASGRVQSVRLERVITSDARIMLKDRISGEIAGYTMKAAVQDGFELEVNGPASRVREVSGEDGRPTLGIVGVDVSLLVSNKARVDNKEREQVLREGFTENLDLVMADGVTVRRKGTDASVSQVPVRFSFEALRDYVDTPELELPVSVNLAPWMIEKGVRVEGVRKTVKVLMQWLRKQLAEFNENNVRVVLDLSKLQVADLKNIEQPEGGGPGPRRAKLTGLWYSLVINADKLTYKFRNERVTPEQYVPAEEIRLVWTE